MLDREGDMKFKKREYWVWRVNADVPVAFCPGLVSRNRCHRINLLSFGCFSDILIVALKFILLICQRKVV